VLYNVQCISYEYCCSAECRLSLVLFMLSVPDKCFMLSAVMLNVVAPLIRLKMLFVIRLIRRFRSELRIVIAGVNPKKLFRP
jgi:hypothetical protein